MLVKNKIEINCDMGEIEAYMKNGQDLALMPYVDAVNIACGFHAGSDLQMKYTIENALKYDLKIGAHPGFEDKPNFGRNEIYLTYSEIKDLIFRQLEVFSLACDSLFTKIHHVKPHGALYNMAAKNQLYAKAIAEAVFEFDSDITLVGLAESMSVQEGTNTGLITQKEVFADRFYLSNGTLAPRNNGGIIQDFNEIENQIRAFLENKPITTLDSALINLNADTICIHSDTLNALEIAKFVKGTVDLFYEPAT